jgi:menaquinone-specific isochorismate synthase
MSEALAKRGVARTAERRLVSVSVPLEDAEPGTLLRLGEGSVRGFWAREGRWFAHVGEAARLEISAPGRSAERFGEIWEGARALLTSWQAEASEGVDAPPPRLFGGFSFRDDHRATGVWEGFPAASFVLPEWELVREERGSTLTLRALLLPEEDLPWAMEDLHARLRNRASRLRGLPGATPREMKLSMARGPESRLAPEAAGSTRPAPGPGDGTERSAWTVGVRRAVAAVTAGDLSKVVLARVQSVESKGRLDPVDVVLNLWREKEGTHVFLFEPVPGRVLVGAAPETLAARNGGVFRATAVAGSTGRGGSEKETEALARSLLASAKDLTEHRICVEDTVSCLRRLSEEVRAQDTPHVLTLPSIQHLETVVEARLRPEVTVLEALEALHPTPAVCGQPRATALEYLRREEGFQRGWYAGPVGWFDGEGDGVFVPALRSAVGCGGEWHLFAGAGIVEGSDPDREWEETRVKLQPMLQALRVAGREG